jgi:hypothetical protein
MRTDAVAASPSLETALEALRARGLELRRGSEPAPPSHARPDPMPSGHAALDAALGTGGWPRGALAFLDAPPGSGATTLALGSLAACQATGGLVAWLDLEGVFDPATASRAGIDLSWLLVARPRDADEAVELAAWLARGGLIEAFVLDLGTAAVSRRALDRLGALLARAGGVGLLLAPAAAAVGAGVRVALERIAWLAVGRDLIGQRVAATVARHRWALAGGTAELDLWFAEGRRIDPALVRGARPVPVLPAEHEDERPALRVVSA